MTPKRFPKKSHQNSQTVSQEGIAIFHEACMMLDFASNKAPTEQRSIPHCISKTHLGQFDKASISGHFAIEIHV